LGIKQSHIIIIISVVAVGVVSSTLFVIADLQLDIEQKEEELVQQQSQLEAEQLAKELNEVELAQQQSKLEAEQLAKEQKQRELDEKQRELDQKELDLALEQLAKEQKQRELEQKELELEAQEKSQIELLAETNPLLKALINGEINFYIDPVRYYAADGVTEAVNEIANKLESGNSVMNRVYDGNKADIVIQWVKDFGSHTAGQAIFNAHIQVGLGKGNCFGDWQPFDVNTVKKIMWHEIGHSLGFGHSNDPNNIMYFRTDTRFVTDVEKTITLDEGFSKKIPFCNSGSYWFDLSGNDQYNGFYVYVITAGTDSSSFLNGDGGTHYPSCGSDGKPMVSISRNCNVKDGDSLLIYNKDELHQTSAIYIDVKIVDKNDRKSPDMEWDVSTLEYSEELLEYIKDLYN